MTGKFTKDTLITFITKVSQFVLNLGASIIIARILGPGRKGIYSLAILLPSCLILFTQPGIGFASVFYIGKKRYSSRDVFGANIVFSALISVLAILVGLIVISFLGDRAFPGVEKQYLLLALSLIPFQVFFTLVVNVLLGLQKIGRYNIVQLTRDFFFLFLVAIFVLGFHFGIRGVIIAQFLSFFIACIILFFQTRKETCGMVFSLNKNLFKDLLSYGSKAYLGSISTFLHLRVDIWMVNIFLNPWAVGLYSVAVAFSEKTWLISQAAGTVLLPKVSSETREERLKRFTPLVCRNILFINSLIALLLYFLARGLVILFYSKAYLESILPFQILLIGTIALSGHRIMTNHLAASGKPMINTYIAALALIVNILLNIMLIPQFGIAGAAWASVGSYLLSFIIKTIVYSRISNNKVKDIIFIKRSDFKFYRDFLKIVRNRIKAFL